jgi:hypothetical protein
MLRARALVLAIAAGACDPEPADLPPPRELRPQASGARVRHGAVQGFLARPHSSSPPLPAVLVLASSLDEATQAAGVAEAEQGAVVLVVPAAVDSAAARAYLAALPDTDPRRLTVRCERASCP